MNYRFFMLERGGTERTRLCIFYYYGCSCGGVLHATDDPNYVLQNYRVWGVIPYGCSSWPPEVVDLVYLSTLSMAVTTNYIVSMTLLL